MKSIHEGKFSQKVSVFKASWPPAVSSAKRSTRESEVLRGHLPAEVKKLSSGTPAGNASGAAESSAPEPVEPEIIEDSDDEKGEEVVLPAMYNMGDDEAEDVVNKKDLEMQFDTLFSVVSKLKASAVISPCSLSISSVFSSM